MKEKDVANEILASLHRLEEQFEDYGTIIQRIRILPDEKAKTAWMSSRCVLGYNPKFMANLPQNHFDGVVEHEFKHYANGHFARAIGLKRVLGRLNSDRWNRAADLEINSTVKNLPEWVCWPKSYKLPENLTAEEYYMHLESLPQDKCPGISDDLKSEDGSPDITDKDADIQEEILDEYERGKKAGSGKGGSKGEVKLKPRKPIDIHSYLRILCSNLSQVPSYGFEETNYNKFGKSAIPSILTFAKNSFLPSIKLAFIIDTSGSRSDEQINRSISSLWATVQSLDAEDCFADMFEVDADIQRVTRIRTKKDIPKDFKGRGGTVLAGAYNEFKIEYDLVIVLTDGHIYWGEFDSIPKKYRGRTVFGIDEKSYYSTYKFCQFPVFIL